MLWVVSRTADYPPVSLGAEVIWGGVSRMCPAPYLLAPLPTERYHLAYKMVRTDSRLVRSILSAHGFQEVSSGAL